MKRFVSLFIVSIFILSMFIPMHHVDAANTEQRIVILGDSIATGYGLPDYIEVPTPYALDSYVSILSQKSEYSLLNMSKDGSTSNKLLTDIAMYNEQGLLGNVDVFIISIGGDDLLHILFSTLASKLEINEEIVLEYMSNISDSGNAASVSQIIQTITEIDTKKVATTYRNNLKQIVAELRTINPSARIIVQTIANPYKGLAKVNSLFIPFENFAEKNIISLNEGITSEANENAYVVADIYTAFNKSTSILTNATNPDTFLDPHPNIEGHLLIANTVGKLLIPYKITISNAGKGKVISDKVTAFPGEIVTLSITPNDGYQLNTVKLNGLKITGNTFTMPAEDVNITATFQSQTGNLLYILLPLSCIILIIIVFVRIKRKNGN